MNQESQLDGADDKIEGGDSAASQAQASSVVPMANPFDSDIAKFSAVLAPIAADNPCGDGKAARYDDAYEALEKSNFYFVS